jgi:hypothetical protein
MVMARTVGKKDSKFAPSFGRGKAGVRRPLIWINGPASEEQTVPAGDATLGVHHHELT